MEIIDDNFNDAGHLLLEAKCLARLGALASESCIIDDILQIEENIDYYFILMRIVKIIKEVEHLLYD
ncbi:MAG: hypothetical protein ACLSWI_08530 [Candidatus Gastranaerophilaceae bacterium]